MDGSLNYQYFAHSIVGWLIREGGDEPPTPNESSTGDYTRLIFYTSDEAPSKQFF